MSDYIYIVAENDAVQAHGIIRGRRGESKVPIERNCKDPLYTAALTVVDYLFDNVRIHEPPFRSGEIVKPENGDLVVLNREDALRACRWAVNHKDSEISRGDLALLQFNVRPYGNTPYKVVFSDEDYTMVTIRPHCECPYRYIFPSDVLDIVNENEED